MPDFERQMAKIADAVLHSGTDNAVYVMCEILTAVYLSGIDEGRQVERRNQTAEHMINQLKEKKTDAA